MNLTSLSLFHLTYYSEIIHTRSIFHASFLLFCIWIINLIVTRNINFLSLINLFLQSFFHSSIHHSTISLIFSCISLLFSISDNYDFYHFFMILSIIFLLFCFHEIRICITWNECFKVKLFFCYYYIKYFDNCQERIVCVQYFFMHFFSHFLMYDWKMFEKMWEIAQIWRISSMARKYNALLFDNEILLNSDKEMLLIVAKQ